MSIRHITALFKAVLLLNACFLMQPGLSPLKVRNAAQAVETALAYLRQKSVGGLPAENPQWKEQTLYVSARHEDLAVTSKLYTADGWSVEVYHGVAPLSKTVYEITMYNSKLHGHWKGQIKAEGMVMELQEFSQLSIEESHKIEEDFSRKAHIPPPKPGGYGH
jgi:hypothetical protein